jgi:tRNA threonylcarbamoyladenosine biosynthesis protein TsaB
MRVLAVDTSSERGSICVADHGEVLGEVRLASSIQHSERLFHSIEFLFQYLPFRLEDIDVFAAARGPGSFTGLRVGIAAMEGFAAAHQKRSAGITTLQALAWKTGVTNALIAPMIDARRGDIYGAVYRRMRTAEAFDTLIEEQRPVVLKPAEWLAVLPQEPLVFCGDGALRYRSLLERAIWRIDSIDLYLASIVAELASHPDAGPLAPLYVRKPDAEIARESVGSTNS